MKKWLTVFPMLLIVSLLFAGIASAHVTVSPKQVPGDSYQKFTLKVPTEKDIPTVKIKVVIPDKVDIGEFEPVSGWTYKVQKNKDGKITSVTWSTTGKGLLPGQFKEFNMMGRVSKGAKQFAWKAYQTYKDGSIVKWVGAEGTDHPASVTTVVASSNVKAEQEADSQTGHWPLYLSIIAVILGVIAIIMSLMKKNRG